MMDSKEMKKLIGQRLNAALAMRNVKQKDLAKHLEIQDNAVSYFCKGDRTPNTVQLAEICDFLDVSADYLLGRSDVASNSITIQQISEKTGLNEKNIKDMMMCNEGEFPIILLNDFINFLIGVVMDYNLENEYIDMLHALERPSIGPCMNALQDGLDVEKYFPEGLSQFAVQRGAERVFGETPGSGRDIGDCQLSPEDAFAFYCMKISDIIRIQLIRTYRPKNKWAYIDDIRDDMIKAIQEENVIVAELKKRWEEKKKNGEYSGTEW